MVPNASLTLTIPVNGGSTTNPATTNGSGVASWTLTSSTVAGSYIYTATDGTVTSGNASVTFDPGAVTAIALSVTGAANITADGTSSTTLSATATDANANVVPGASLTLSIPANGGSTTNPQTTDASGIATWTLTSSTVAGIYTYSATDGAVTSGNASVTFDPGAISNITLVLTGSNSITADGASTTTFEATAVDTYSNVVPNASLTLTIPANGGTTANPATTNASGVANWTLTSSTVDGTYSYTATDGTVTSNSVDVTFNPFASTLSWDVATHDYGTPGAAVTQTFTLTNTGAQTSGAITITLSGNGAKWSKVVDNCTAPLALNATCTVDIEYDGFSNPKGTQTATLDATAAPGGTTVVNLSGTTL